MKTNRQKNIEHAARERQRPKEPLWDFTGLEAVMRQWVKGRE